MTCGEDDDEGAATIRCTFGCQQLGWWEGNLCYLSILFGGSCTSAQSVFIDNILLLSGSGVQVLGRMKQAMVDHSSSASHSFLLDDDSTLPFAAQDILMQMDDKVRQGLSTCLQCLLFAHRI